MPFNEFGEIIHLEKISQLDWISYIINRFRDTGGEHSSSFTECDVIST
jgi:hypothetical protein